MRLKYAFLSANGSVKAEDNNNNLAVSKNAKENKKMLLSSPFMVLSQENDLSLVILTATLAFVILAAGIILLMVTYHKKLLKQQDEYQRGLLNAILEAQEKERQRIAEDLHDDMGALLSAIKLRLAQVAKKSKDNAIVEDTIEARLLLDEAVKNVRTISKELLPVSLKEFGLVSALYELSKRMNPKGILNIYVNNETEKKLEYKTELAIYRIIQEAFSNSMKHGGASQVNVKLDIQPASLKLNIQDNGWGFNIPEYRSTPLTSKGLGLRNIESRVAMLNGRVSFESERGKGCRIKVDLPLSTPQNKS